MELAKIARDDEMIVGEGGPAINNEEMNANAYSGLSVFV